MKPRSSYSKTAFILLFSVFLVAAVTKAKSSLPDITLEQAKEINADNTVIFLSAMENIATVQICHAIRIKAESLLPVQRKHSRKVLSSQQSSVNMIFTPAMR